MITPKEIRDLTRTVPFRPFRIRMSDGSHYDITKQDMAFVGRHTVEVGQNLDSDGLAEYFSRCSISHITKPEDIPDEVSR